MYKKINKYLAVVLAILVADVIQAYFLLVMAKFQSTNSPYKSTIIMMIASVIIYYPLITYFDKWMNKGSKDLIKNSKRVVDHNYLGPLLGFSAAFLIIWLILARIWYQRNFIEDISNWFDKTI